MKIVPDSIIYTYVKYQKIFHLTVVLKCGTLTKGSA